MNYCFAFLLCSSSRAENLRAGRSCRIFPPSVHKQDCSNKPDRSGTDHHPLRNCSLVVEVEVGEAVGEEGRAVGVVPEAQVVRVGAATEDREDRVVGGAM